MNIRRLILALCVCLVATGVSAQTFTDDPLVPGVTLVRAVHLTELRQAVDQLRALAGLPASSWTDPTIAPGTTVIKAIHMLELRARFSEAAARMGYQGAPFANPTLTSGVSVVRAVDITELRSQVRAATSQAGAGVGCFLTFSGAGSFDAGGGQNTFPIVADVGCAWSVTTPASWITINTPSGAGSATELYTVAQNTGSGRAAYIYINGHPLNVEQFGADGSGPPPGGGDGGGGGECSFVVSNAWAPMRRSGGSGSITITSAPGCAWAAASNAPWASISSGAGSGSATISYSIAPTNSSRIARLSVAGAQVVIAQGSSEWDEFPPPDFCTPPIYVDCSYWDGENCSDPTYDYCTGEPTPPQGDPDVQPHIAMEYVDVELDEVALYLEGHPSSAGMITVQLKLEDGTLVLIQENGPEFRGRGLYTVDGWRSRIPIGHYVGIVATWAIGSEQVQTSPESDPRANLAYSQRDFNALGLYRQSAYNTPTEASCVNNPTPVDVFLNPTGTNTSAGPSQPHQCFYGGGQLRSDFTTRLALQGNGQSINFGALQNDQCFGVRPLYYAEVMIIKGAAPTLLPIDATIVAFNKPINTDLDYGDKVLIDGIGVKTVGDLCPSCSATHFDNWVSNQACDAHSFQDLGTPGLNPNDPTHGYARVWKLPTQRLR